jgi:hypothetical protein
MLPINKVISISLVANPTGLAAYSINNLVCFTRETPAVALTGLYAAYASASEVATAWGSASQTYAAAVAVFEQSPNVISGGGLFIVVPMLTDEVLEQAITRAAGLVYYGACACNYALGVSGPTGYTGATAANLEATRAASVAETERKILFLGTTGPTDLQNNGLADLIKDASQEHTRVLFHSSNDYINKFKWGYAGRGMSTNFSAANTTSTMNLKSISGVVADDISTTLHDAALAVGADIYPNIAGLGCVKSFGANEFFDNVYNLDWILGALEVAGFNCLRTTGTKIPQTEQGMDTLKGAYRKVLEQAVSNGFIAPGTWTGTDTFGNPEDFRRNISDFGFYIYSLPVSQQSAVDRAARAAPVVQIALKYAGAIHTSSVIVRVNP